MELRSVYFLMEQQSVYFLKEQQSVYILMEKYNEVFEQHSVCILIE